MSAAQKLINALLGLGVVVAVVLALGAGNGAGRLGGSGFAEHYPIHFVKGLRVGESESYPTVSKVLTGACNPTISTLPLGATSTEDFTCSVTGVASGDRVFVTLPGSGAGFGSFVVDRATSSTNTITFGVTNLTGAATSSFPIATTSVQYVVIDTN